MELHLRHSLKMCPFSFRHHFHHTFGLSLSLKQYAKWNYAYVNLRLMTHLQRFDIIVV
jgi:hypothetical protein